MSSGTGYEGCSARSGPSTAWQAHAKRCHHRAGMGIFRRFVCASLFAASAACTAGVPNVAEGDHATVRSEVPWCSETTDWIDEAIVMVGAFFDLAPDEIPHVVA